MSAIFSEQENHLSFKHRYLDGSQSLPGRETLLRFLVRDYEATDPLAGSYEALHERRANTGKDSLALDSLSTVGELVAELCGWAIDHEIGKAALGVGYFFPGQIVSSVPEKARQEWERRSKIANSHEPEREGARIRGFNSREGDQHKELPPEVQREMIINILRRLNHGLDLSLLKDLMEALEALNLGETLPLFESSKPKARAGDYTRAKLQLDILCWIEYHARRSHDGKAAPAIKRVLMALNREPTEDAVRTVREWHGRVVKKLGIVHVEQMLGFARNSASYPPAYDCGRDIGDTAWSEDEWREQVARIEEEFSSQNLLKICGKLRSLL